MMMVNNINYCTRGQMKDKEFKDMTLADLLASNLTLEDIDDIDDIIEEQLKENCTLKTNPK